MKKKIYLYLCGGLGNQLFQFFAARNLAIKNKAQLIVDVKTGFLTDFKWNNTLKLNIKKNKSILLTKKVFFFYFYRVYKLIFKKKLINSFFKSKVIDETCTQKFENKINDISFNKKLYLLGFFQSDKYFNENKNKIIKNIVISPSKKKKFLELKRQIVKSNSVSIGVRSYETETRNTIEMMGGITTNSFFHNSIEHMMLSLSNPQFYIFSTKIKNANILLEKISYLKKFKFNIIAEDNGFSGAVENLWLMSHCKHHIISNSSFYWWAAYLSSFKYKKQIVLCSKKFVNNDSLALNWRYIEK
jgi:hypothetical protein